MRPEEVQNRGACPRLERQLFEAQRGIPKGRVVDHASDAAAKRLKLPNSLRQLPAPWGKRRFPELDEALRKHLEDNELDVFLIISVANPDEVRDLFIRLQS